jgi:hypothetical protein
VRGVGGERGGGADLAFELGAFQCKCLLHVGSPQKECQDAAAKSLGGVVRSFGRFLGKHLPPAQSRVASKGSLDNGLAGLVCPVWEGMQDSDWSVYPFSEEKS